MNHAPASIPFYPVLFGLYFVLFVFYENLGEVYLHQLVLPVLLLSLLTVSVSIFFGWVLRSRNKGALLTAGILSVVFLHSALSSLVMAATGLSIYVFSIIELSLVGAVVVYGLFFVRQWRLLNRALNLMGATLLVLTSAQIAAYAMKDGGDIIEPQFVAKGSRLSGTTGVGDYQPDVYFILTDAYARADTLKDYYGYDNSEFIGYLEATGFSVANSSVGNYPATSMVVNSMLNMDYVADEAGFMTLGNGKKLKAGGRIVDNNVGRMFRRMGYRIVTIRSSDLYIQTEGAQDYAHLTSWWLPHDEFARALLETTVLPFVFKRLTGQLFSDRERVDFAIAELSRQIPRPGPKFVITHIMAPHQPFIYNHDGSHTDGDKPGFGSLEGLPATVRAYRDQVHHLNSLLKNLIEQILLQSDSPPIIVLQGDHGLRLTRYSQGVAGTKTSQFNTTCPRELLTNLNAMYLPGEQATENFYDSISSVNTFRLIFDSYFDGEFGFVPDRAYVTRYSDSGATELVEVTGQSEACSPEWERALRLAR